MKDARDRDIPTETISASTSWADRDSIFGDLKCGHPKTRLLYITPEFSQSPKFRSILETVHGQGQLTRIVIDEAHCISEWGHDFRQAYRSLSWFKQTLRNPSIPIMALTATATPRVREDIFASLDLSISSAKVFLTTTARPNIHYELRYFSESAPCHPSGDDSFVNLVSWLEERAAKHSSRITFEQPTSSRHLGISPMTGIIYAPSRLRAETLAQRLNSNKPRIPSMAYHAKLDDHTRAEAQKAFLKPTVHKSPNLPLNIIVATNAFGMGIDAPEVRFVIHYGQPRRFEQFVQESGRAGRDGKAAISLIFYSREERDRAEWLISNDIAKKANQKPDTRRNEESLKQLQARMESFKEIIKFCESTTECRHDMIWKYFAGSAEKIQTQIQATTGPPTCYYACDFCKEGEQALTRRKEKGLATDEESMDFTQRERATQADGGSCGHGGGSTCHLCDNGPQELMEAGGVSNLLAAMFRQPVFLPG